VREESHLEDMRSAIRGDFERLAERQGEQELLRMPDEEPPEPEEEAAPERVAEEEPRRSWFSRFVAS
jgi:hypothetical protein